MYKKTMLTFVMCLITHQWVMAHPGVKIKKISGDIRVRHGLEENWLPASRGMTLEYIDSIFALEGEVVLETEDGSTFRLGSNSILDISDLRRITKKELFLYLMSEKVGKIPQREEKTKLRIGNVSVVHGESKSKSRTIKSNSIEQKWRQELNGAKAMFDQEFYTNTVVKLHKIRKNYSTINDFGELHFYLGKTFEELDEDGQALDVYQIALDQSRDCDLPQINRLKRDAQRAIKQLKK